MPKEIIELADQYKKLSLSEFIKKIEKLPGEKRRLVMKIVIFESLGIEEKGQARA